MVTLVRVMEALTEVIVQYHDAHVSPSEQVRDKAIRPSLEILINRCTSYYPERKDLLTYLSREIKFIKAIIDHEGSFTPEGLLFNKGQLAQLFINIRALLCTKKSETYSVHMRHIPGSEEGSIEVILHGLVKDGYLDFGHFCDSGTLLDEFLREKLHLTTSSSDDVINELAGELCDNYQNYLLAVEGAKYKMHLEAERARNKELEAQLSAAMASSKKHFTPTLPMLALYSELYSPLLWRKPMPPKETPPLTQEPKADATALGSAT